MLDDRDREPDNTSDPSPGQLQGSYPPQFEQQAQEDEYYPEPLNMQSRRQQMASRGQYEPQSLMQSSQPQSGGGMTAPFDAMGQVIDPDDPMLDADPFGLSASMHYPTSYSSMEPRAPQG